MLNKINKATELLTTLQKYLIRASFLTIYQSFVLVIVTFYMTKVIIFFHYKMESVEYSTALAITGTIIGFFGKELYQELYLISL